jgi:hypothetical protein
MRYHVLTGYTRSILLGTIIRVNSKKSAILARFSNQRINCAGCVARLRTSKEASLVALSGSESKPFLFQFISSGAKHSSLMSTLVASLRRCGAMG